MSGIIKRRKTSDYAQIHNGALQQLEDIRSIGLISHLMSLPDTWEIKKMQLYKKFGRGPITNAIAELETKKYWVTIQYRDGKKTLYYYNVSDVAFTDYEVLNMIHEVKQGGFKITKISESFVHLLSISENQQWNNDHDISEDSCIVENEQRIVNNASSTIDNRQLLNKYKKTNSNKKNNVKQILLINKELTADEFQILLTNSCNKFYNVFAVGRWSKKQWNTLIVKFVTETIEEGRYRNVSIENIEGYAYVSIKSMAYKFDIKNGVKVLNDKINNKIEAPFYNWLEVDNEDEERY